jgi:hypothetical protein
LVSLFAVLSLDRLLDINPDPLSFLVMIFRVVRDNFLPMGAFLTKMKPILYGQNQLI